MFKRIEFISSVLNISRFLCHSRVQNILHDILVLVLIVVLRASALMYRRSVCISRDL